MASLQTFYDPDKKILFGPENQRLISERASFGQLLLFMLERESEKVLQVSDDSGHVFTGQDILQMSIRVAQNLIKYGCNQEDVIGFVAGNTKYLSSVIFGIVYCGLQFNPLDPSFDENEIMHMFKITKPKIIFCDTDVYDKVLKAIKKLELKTDIFIMSDDINCTEVSDDVKTVAEFLKPNDFESKFVLPKLKHGSDQTMAIICSSGSTGLPKGVCLSHKTLIQNVMGNAMEPNQIMTCFSTMYWISGLTCLLMTAVFGFKRVITNQPFSPKLLLQLIEKYQITLLLTPPSQMAMLVQYDKIGNYNLSSVKRYICGGSAVPLSVGKKMQECLPNGLVLVGYGMSEVGGAISIEVPKSTKIGSAGKVSPSFQVKVIDCNGNSLSFNQIGEICINNGNKWSGYYRNEEDTKSAYDSSGWLHSGDLGYFDEDGYIFVTGRKKEILKYKNFHIYPAEIESIILEIPDVLEVCVVGLSDIVATDLPAAAIVKKSNSNLTEKMVYDYVAQKMADFKKLRGGVYFVQSFPKTASGKIQRIKIKDNLERKFNRQLII